MLPTIKKIIALVLAVLMFSACVDQQSSDIRFTIYNQTNKEVTIFGYSVNLLPNQKGIADLIFIAPHSNFTAIRMNGINDTRDMRYYSLQNGGVDSVRIVFEDNKLLIYTSKDVARNDPKAFSIISGDHIGEDEFGHYITMEDYALAVDCGEECF